MRYRRLFLIYGIILILCVSHALQAEEHAEGGNGENSSAGVRSTAPLVLNSDTIDLIKQFFTPSEKYIKSRFSESLPQALEKSIKDKEDDGIAKDLAELFGQLNSEQATKIYQEALKGTKSTAASCDTEPENSKRLDALKTRLYWAAKFVLEIKDSGPQPSCPTRASPFQVAFAKHWAEIKKHNDEFHERLKLALGGNTDAINKLKTEYDNGALLGFLENQNETGNTELATNLATALSEKNAAGHFTISASGADGETTQVFLGRYPKDFSKLFKELKADPSQKGISGLAFSPTPVEKPARLIVPASISFFLVTPNEPGDKSKTPGKGKTIASNPQPTRQGKSDPVSTTTSNFAMPAEVLLALQNKCVSCHGPGGKVFAKFPMSATGDLAIDKNKNAIDKSSAAFKEKIQGLFDRAVVADGGMPPEDKPQLTAGEKSALQKWTASLGARIL